jgi:hypothetical protein
MLFSKDTACELAYQTCGTPEAASTYNVQTLLCHNITTGVPKNCTERSTCLLLSFSLLQSLMRPGGIRVNCTDVVLSQQRDTLALQTALYCGYAQARCNGTTATNAYAAAFDWADSSVVTNSVGNKSRTNGRGTSKGSMLGSGLNQGLRYSPDIYFNDTYGVPGQAPVVYQRIPAVVNMAINSWVKTTFGESNLDAAAVKRQ